MVKSNTTSPTSLANLASGSIIFYENNGVPLIASVQDVKKDKHIVLNMRGREAELQLDRLYYLHATLPAGFKSNQEKADFLLKSFEKAEQEIEQLKLEDLWAVINSSEKECSAKELCELYYGTITLSQHLTCLLGLIRDKIYFKRRKFLFAPRSVEVVEELSRAEQAEREHQEFLVRLCLEVSARLQSPDKGLSVDIAKHLQKLEILAASVGDDAHAKDARELLESILDKCQLQLGGTPEEKAFGLLLRLGLFTPDQNLAVIRYNPRRIFSKQALAEAESLLDLLKIEDFTKSEPTGLRQDFTNLEVFTIDDITTLDMDDGLSLELTPRGYRLGVHISDVANVIKADSVLDEEARQRATSIYCPEGPINMLPEALSQNKISLTPGSIRPVISYLFELNQDLTIASHQIVPSIIKSRQRMTYDEVDQKLEEQEPILSTIYNIATNLETSRLLNGAIKIHKNDVNVVLNPDGSFHLVRVDESSPARNLIAEMMILTNGVSADFAVKNNFGLIFRGQAGADEEVDEIKEAAEAKSGQPARPKLKKSAVSTIAQPHAALALRAYAQVTSPIRRYSDLINQRQLFNFIAYGRAHYSIEDLNRVIYETESSVFSAQMVGRLSKRYWLLKYLKQVSASNRLIKGTITRTDGRKPIVELDEVFISIPVGITGTVKIGMQVDIRILDVDPHADYIRLERA